MMFQVSGQFFRLIAFAMDSAEVIFVLHLFVLDQANERYSQDGASFLIDSQTCSATTGHTFVQDAVGRELMHSFPQVQILLFVYWGG